MTDDELAAIEARLAATTRGPWRSCWDDAANGDGHSDAYDWPAIYHPIDGVKPVDLPHEAQVVSVMYYDGTLVGCREPDAAFIAHAREDVPALLAEVRRLQTLLDFRRSVVQPPPIDVPPPRSDLFRDARDVTFAAPCVHNHVGQCPICRGERGPL